MRASLKTALLATSCLLAACAVGPDFMHPAAPDVARYTDTDLPQKTASADSVAGAAQTFVRGKDIPVEWWKLFNSPALNDIVEQALKANPDLKAASAALRQAKENYLAARGELLPSVDAAFNVSRQRFNPSSFGEVGVPASIFTLYNASVNVSYGFDIWGGTRRTIEAAKAQADYQRYQMDAAYLSLTANIITAAITEASLVQQIKETNNIADIEGKQFNVLKTQFDLGASPKSIMLAQAAVLAQTQALLPPLEKQLAQVRNLLAVLTGTLPGNSNVTTFDLASLHLPEELPVSLPSKLVGQRPDIRAAEAQLHVASAEVGVATANMLPQITLTGGIGSEAIKTGSLFTSGAEVWNVGGGLLQPLFRGGELLHQKRASVAAFEQAKAHYQSIVLTAFENVGDTLRALQYDADGLAAEAHADAAAKESLDLTQLQYSAGAISYPQLLDAQRTYSQARIGLVQAQALRLADTAALFQALGGGWQGTAKAAKPAAAPAATPKPEMFGPPAPAALASTPAATPVVTAPAPAPAPVATDPFSVVPDDTAPAVPVPAAGAPVQTLAQPAPAIPSVATPAVTSEKKP